MGDMRYFALATDYDGTLAGPDALPTIERLKASGRQVVLVTGRLLEDLLDVFPGAAACDRVVAENGAVLYTPASRAIRTVGEPPPPEFVSRLGKRGVAVAVGRVIAATRVPNEGAVLETIREMGLELQIIFNKGAVMILPATVNKATGLRAALEELGLSPHNVVGAGDGENDHAFLEICECACAVPGALPSLRADVRWRVAELAGRMVADDLAGVDLPRRTLTLGEGVDIPAYGKNLLLSGHSGSGKSSLAQAFLEQLHEKEYQYCVLDPEGDYPEVESAVCLGGPKSAPTIDEVLQLLEQPARNAVVNLLGVSLEHRPAFFERLFHALLDLRQRRGRPHWIVVDEAHHMLRKEHPPLQGMLYITVHPERVTAPVDLEISTTARQGVYRIDHREFRGIVPKAERRRHRRHYSQGELGPDKSFYFRGPDGRLQLRAQNLQVFLQMADGVDDATWTHHLENGDIAAWFRDSIKDESLAEEAERVAALPPSESRARLRARIESQYTAAE